LPWEALRGWKGDGLIAMVYWDTQYRALLRKRIPCVNACARLNTRKLHTVFSDNPAIGRVAAEHLLEAGLGRFAFLVRRNLYHDRARCEGFERALRERGLPCQRIELGRKSPGLHDVRDMQYIASRLRDLERPVGIFAAHDNLGCQILEVCRQLGIKVPYEAAVIGVNNYELLCETARPPLSSICQQAERTGYEAARLLDRIVAGDAGDLEHVRLPPGRLVKRRSTDFLAIDDSDVADAIAFIRDNVTESITVDDVLERVAVSRRTLDKRFIAALGHPPAEEIRMTRIRRAQQLLADTSEQILSIAMRCGFRSVSGFNRAFRDTTGLTPRQYRRQFHTIRTV
jgi:LacI family transcriptional regulator